VLPDLCTREITGWAIAARQSAALVVTALRMAFDTGRLSIDGIAHTDRGAEYTSASYRRELARTGAR
jgi:transposase InsO family protein